MSLVVFEWLIKVLRQNYLLEVPQHHSDLRRALVDRVLDYKEYSFLLFPREFSQQTPVLELGRLFSEPVLAFGLFELPK